MAALHVLLVAALVVELEQLVAGDVAAGLDQPRQPPVADRQLLLLAALADEREPDLGTVEGDVLVADRRKPVGAVLSRVRGVADADQRLVEQADAQREHAFAAEAGCAQVRLDAGAEARQHLPEADHPAELDPVAVGRPVGVIAVLLAAPRVAARRLEVPVGSRADPDVLPGRGEHQRLDAGADGVRHQFPIRLPVREPRPAPRARDAGAGVVDVAEGVGQVGHDRAEGPRGTAGRAAGSPEATRPGSA